MNVAVIGAGLVGLVAARRLRAAGCSVVIVEKSRGLGGRIASRRVAETVVDHGTPAIDTAGDPTLAQLVRELAGDEGIWLSDHEVAFPTGLTRLAKLAAQDLDVTLATRIAALRWSGTGYELAGEQGNTHGHVDAVIITAPAPQAADLLEASSLDADRVAQLRTVAYDPAIMMIAGVPMATPDTLEPWPVSAPFLRITNESAKGRPAQAGVVAVVARLDASTSAPLLDAADAQILDRHLGRLMQICGATGEPAWTQIKRWRYATVRTPLTWQAVNAPDQRVVIAGDTLATSLADVAASGARAADHVLGLGPLR